MNRMKRKACWSAAALLGAVLAVLLSGCGPSGPVRAAPEVNDAPTARNDSFNLQMDSTNAPLDVLPNDDDADNDALSIVAASIIGSVPEAEGALVTIANAGALLRYTPPPGFIGTQWVQYTISDGRGGSATALAVIAVLPLPLPTFAAPDVFSIAADSGANPLDVLSNDIDGAGGGLTVTAVERVSALPPTEADEIDTDGEVVLYTPAAGYSGVVTLQYTITDANDATATAVIVISVSAAVMPPLAFPDVVTVAVNSGPIEIDALANDVDFSGGGLVITEASSIGLLPPGTAGTVSTDGSVVGYQPAPGYVGVETLGYTITDGNESSATGTITVVVLAELPNLPPLALPDLVTIGQDAGPASIDVLANDVSVSGASLSVTAVEVVTSLPPATHQATVVANEVVFTAANGFAGIVTLNYTVSDGTAEAIGTAVVTVTPGGVSLMPVAVPDVATVSTGAVSSIDVLANDLDPFGGGLTLTGAAVVLAVPPNPGSVAIVGNEVQYTPSLLYTGLVTVSYSLEDADGQTAIGVLEITVLPALP